ncbi:MAG: thiolase family protein [Bdellovibrionia bacterium]
MNREIVVVGYARTPFGSFQGSLASLSAPKLGAQAIQGALQRSGVSPDQVSEVILGQVLTAGSGQAPARQATLYAGLPQSVAALTINKVCGSGMKSILLGTQSLLLGDSQVVIAGGMESMSGAPYLLPQARSGFRMGHQTVLDSMISDGLWDPYHQSHMGKCAELCAREWKFSREQQDQFAMESFKRAQAAQKAGKWSQEMIPVEVPGKKGEVQKVESDEGPAKVQFDKIPTLKPAFDQQGTVTAANASTINDGACAMVLTTADQARSLKLKPVAKIVSYATHAQAPEWFTTAPAQAMRKAMAQANWQMKDVDLFEVNEAFAVVALAAQKELGIDSERLNVWGGAIALGHPIGASGTRIVMTLISALQDRGLKRGVASICIGGGEATAIAVERL